MCMVPYSINLIRISKLEKKNIVNYYHSYFFILHVLNSIFSQNVDLCVHHSDHMVVGVIVVVLTHYPSDVGNDGV